MARTAISMFKDTAASPYLKCVICVLSVRRVDSTVMVGDSDTNTWNMILDIIMKAILIITGSKIINIVINVTVVIITNVTFIDIQIRQTRLLRKVMRKPKPMKTITCTS